MATFGVNKFYFLVLICSSLLIPSSCHLPSLNNHVALFVFGDSFYDAGNNNYIKSAGKANFWPYGKSFFKHPTGRANDGRIVPDFIAEYLKLPLIPPYLQPGYHQFANGTNFASGGAGALVETHQGKVLDLKTQLRYFKNVGEQLTKTLGTAETKTLLSKALYLFCFGVNDYGSYLIRNTSIHPTYTKKEFVGMVIGNLTTATKEIYNTGGKKFGFVNMPPLGSFPSSKDSTASSSDEGTELAKLHNRVFPKALKELQTQLPQFNYSVFDAFTSLSARIDNPSKYGFKEGKVACCGSGPHRGISSCGGKGSVKEYQLCDNPSDYVFFDSGHPSEKADSQFAKLMWSGPSDVVKPYNLKTLLEA